MMGGMSGKLSPRRENISKTSPPKKKSFKDVAKLAKVSPATVSRVAEGSGQRRSGHTSPRAGRSPRRFRASTSSINETKRRP